jgi:hypothetical protein
MKTVSIYIQAPVHERHLELELEVRHGAKPAHDDLRARRST